MNEEKLEERFIHRLEAFSDVVIGFSLAQLGVSLTIPSSGSELVRHPGWLGGFVFTFGVVCSMWYFHHRLFVRFFVPRFWPVVLNFIWLGLLVLLVYSAEIYVHLPADVIVMRIYFAAYTLAYGILGLQYVIGLRSLRSSMDDVTKASGERAAWFMFLWTLPFLFCLIIVSLLPPGPLFGILITAAFVSAGFASGILGSRLRKRARCAAATGDGV